MHWWKEEEAYGKSRIKVLVNIYIQAATKFYMIRHVFCSSCKKNKNELNIECKVSRHNDTQTRESKMKKIYLVLANFESSAIGKFLFIKIVFVSENTVRPGPKRELKFGPYLLLIE